VPQVQRPRGVAAWTSCRRRRPVGGLRLRAVGQSAVQPAARDDPMTRPRGSSARRPPRGAASTEAGRRAAAPKLKPACTEERSGAPAALYLGP